MAISAILGSFVSTGITLFGLGVLLFVVLKMGRFVTKLIVGFVMNVVLGLILLFIAHSMLGINFSYTMPELLSILFFGLPGVGTMIVLKLSGVALAIL